MQQGKRSILKKMSEVMAQELSSELDNSEYYIGLEEDKGAYVLYMTQGYSLGAVSIHDIEDYRWFTQTLSATESINFHMSDIYLMKASMTSL